MKAFLDTGAFYAAAITNDHHSEMAKKIFLTLQNSKAKLFTSDYVLGETYTLLNARDGHQIAVAFMNTFDRAISTCCEFQRQLKHAPKTYSANMTFPALVSPTAPALP